MENVVSLLVDHAPKSYRPGFLATSIDSLLFIWNVDPAATIRLHKVSHFEPSRGLALSHFSFGVKRFWKILYFFLKVVDPC